MMRGVKNSIHFAGIALLLSTSCMRVRSAFGFNLVPSHFTSISKFHPVKRTLLAKNSFFKLPSKLFMSSDTDTANKITSEDNLYMKKAIEAASIGVGNTYPNPAVGCVLVSSDEVIGVGAHPKAGYPHAEVFALFEACGYVESGVEAATTVVNSTKKANSDDTPDISKVDELMAVYSSTDGAKELFKGKLSDKDVTAYVTLEPCCHYGKTPPCAFSLVQAGVKRVVVGFRDPNPRVDGGGVTLLQNEGVHVDLMLKDESEAESKEEAENAKACSDIVSAFVKRISPRTEEDGMALVDYDESMNGAKRRQLRSIAGRKKKDGSMMEFYWPAYSDSVDASDDSIDLEEAIGELSFDHRWMETIDGALWEHEIILLRLTNAVQKKKGAKILGERIAEELNAHVAQVVGHTALLYRPGRPPVLDLLSDA